jgi:hypothetical protein
VKANEKCTRVGEEAMGRKTKPRIDLLKTKQMKTRNYFTQPFTGISDNKFAYHSATLSFRNMLITFEQT